MCAAASLYTDVMQELEARIWGRVQMVMFRDHVQRKAKKMQIVGYVKNRPDGSVEVRAQGEREMLERLVAELHTGSLLSRVDLVEVRFMEPNLLYRTFDIQY